MTDFWSNLLARSGGSAGVIGPRLASRFEPLSPASTPPLWESLENGPEVALPGTPAATSPESLRPVETFAGQPEHRQPPHFRPAEQAWPLNTISPLEPPGPEANRPRPLSPVQGAPSAGASETAQGVKPPPATPIRPARPLAPAVPPTRLPEKPVIGSLLEPPGVSPRPAITASRLPVAEEVDQQPARTPAIGRALAALEALTPEAGDTEVRPLSTIRPRATQEAPAAVAAKTEAQSELARPTITVTIGRIEIQAPENPPPLQPATRQPYRPPMTLDDYLKQRSGEMR